MSKELIKHEAQTRKPMNGQDQYDKQVFSASKAHQLIAAVTTPLGFFVLALLIVESFLATVLIFAPLDPPNRMTCICLGFFLLIFVVLIVSIFTWFKPKNLTFGKQEHSNLMDARKQYPQSSRLRQGQAYSHSRRALNIFQTNSTGSSKKSKLAR